MNQSSTDRGLFDLSGRVAIVTGTSRGLGQASGQITHFLHRGHNQHGQRQADEREQCQVEHKYRDTARELQASEDLPSFHKVDQGRKPAARMAEMKSSTRISAIFHANHSAAHPMKTTSSTVLVVAMTCRCDNGLPPAWQITLRFYP